MTRAIETIRNIGIIAHIDAGKTTTTERLLFVAGAKHRVGFVDDGTTETDDDPEEAERGITIYAACVTFPWKGCTVNLLDTPGHVDFTAEVERCLRVLDGAVVVFSAREGVEAQSETVWRQANKYAVPRIAFINKLDREGARFEEVLDEMRTRLGAEPVPIQIPVGRGPEHGPDPFRAVIDLIEMKMLTFDPADSGKTITVSDIPAELADDAAVWRESMLEKLYEQSDEMMERALAEEPIGVELIQATLRTATISRAIQPVLCGSSLHGIGAQPVLDAVKAYLPSPQDIPPVTGRVVQGKGTVEEQRHPSDDDPFCALVFKILPAKTGDFYWLRVYSGKIQANSRALCVNRDKKENITQLWLIHATKKEREGQIDEVGAGDIVGVIGPRYGLTGDTFCDVKFPIQLPTIEFADAVISMAVEPESTADRKKLLETLEMVKKQDPTFKVRDSEETGQTIISGMGVLHLEVIRNRLLRDFKLNVKVHEPRVSYRETIASAVEVTGECHRILAGQQLFAKLRVAVEPMPAGPKPIVILNRIDPETIDPVLVDAAREELQARAEGGGLIGSFPLTGLKITMLAAERAEVGSTPAAFAIAAADAFEQALTKGGPVLLEPLMKVEIIVPEQYFGDVTSDLQRRRGLVTKTDVRGDRTAIEAQVPLAEVFNYDNEIKSLTAGRAGHSMEPLEYAPAPDRIAQSFGYDG